MLFYANPNHKQHVRLIKHLYESYEGEKLIQPTSRFTANLKLNILADTIVFAGFIRGDGIIYNWCVDNRKRFLYLDHAYLNRGYNNENPDDEWVRITDSKFTHNTIMQRSSLRWDTYFAEKFPIKPYSPPGDNILVLPPSHATQYLFPGSKAWMDQTIDKIKAVTGCPTVIREKPMQVKVDAANNTHNRVEYDHTRTIEQELKLARCVVTFNSAVPVLATTMGIPVITSNVAAAWPMSIPIETIENPVEPDRESWLHQLVHTQYMTKELINGDFWSMINE